MSPSPDFPPGSVALRLAAVRDRIRRAADTAGRDPGEVRLMAVSKTFPAERVLEVLEAGQFLLGENRIQECREKIPAVNAAWATRSGESRDAPSPEWRLIGHLQRNKVRLALELFDAIDSVDSFRLLEALGEEARRQEKLLSVLLQFNCSGEQTKGGFTPADLDAVADRVPGVAGILVTGLMTIGYHGDDPAEARPGFRRLRELRGELEARWGRPLPELSMGMSGDLEVAIEEGATVVRVGTAIFGDRSAPPADPSP